MSPSDSPLRYWLGRRAAVVVDRPLGNRHPDFPELVYPINFGYIPNTEAGDREPLNAYVLGVSGPVSAFLGDVIAIVVRHDDAEDKLVVAPAGTTLDRTEIQRAVQFQERFFTTDILLASDMDS